MRDRNAPLTVADVDSLDWTKMDGLLPVAVQDADTQQLLMLGYMNQEAFQRTLESGLVTFYSRSKQRLWTKGESSGNHLRLDAIFADCDNDALLARAVPQGPTCHLGSISCFTEDGPRGPAWLAQLERIVAMRAEAPASESYTARLLEQGITRIAQKVGEEGVELALAAAAGEKEACVEEAADLLYHMTVLMKARGFGWNDVAATLKERHTR